MLMIVSYDIVDDKRRTKLAKRLCDFGKRVQYSVFECDLSKEQLKKMINEADKETKTKKIMAYRHVTIDSDFRIHLFHDSKTTSPLGLSLASVLKEFGLVNHSIWIEMNCK